MGASIEDATGRVDDPIYPKELAIARVRAAVAAARALPIPFTLTARAENLISGRPDLPDTLVRLKAFAEAGADVLYAPGLVTSDQRSAVVKAPDRYWSAIVGNGAQESACGWCKDKWGVSWQITPRVLTEALAAGGDEAKRAFDAMMDMKKIDVAAIEAARRGRRS